MAGYAGADGSRTVTVVTQAAPLRRALPGGPRTRSPVGGWGLLGAARHADPRGVTDSASITRPWPVILPDRGPDRYPRLPSQADTSEEAEGRAAHRHSDCEGRKQGDRLRRREEADHACWPVWRCYIS
jgi:hypothetical protein